MARALDPIGEWLLAERDAFVSQDLRQVRPLRDLAADGLQQRPARRAPRVVARVAARGAGALARRGRGAARDATEIAAPSARRCGGPRKDYVKQLYRSMYDQGLIARATASRWRALPRGATAAFELPRELRPKNAYNLVRLLDAAIEWLRNGAPALRGRGGAPRRLLAIKRGEVPLGGGLAPGRSADARARGGPQRHDAAGKPDVARADALLRRVRRGSGAALVAGEPGPFGGTRRRRRRFVGGRAMSVLDVRTERGIDRVLAEESRSRDTSSST